MSEDLTPDMITEQLKAKGVNIEEGIIEQPKAVQEETKEPKKEEAVLEPAEALEEMPEAPNLEVEAAAKGWKEGGTKSAEEFLRAEPLYDEIKNRGKEIKELKSTLDELKSHMDKQQELGYNKALKELQAERATAIEYGDVAQVDEIEGKIAEHKGTVADLDLKSIEVKSFTERNTDWIKDPSFEAQQIRDFAQKRDEELVRFNLSPQEHLKVIEKDIKARFPDRFPGEADEVVPAPTVESGNTQVQAKKRAKFIFSDLSKEQKQCARHFERKGVMKIDAYIQQLMDIGELK